MQLGLWMCTYLPSPLPMKGFFRVNETTQTKQITYPIRWGGMPVGLCAQAQGRSWTRPGLVTVAITNPASGQREGSKSRKVMEE